jgi:TonB-dependent starch-binding outer membrane protein SusC
MKRKEMIALFRLRLFTMMALVFCTFAALAQSHTVTGKITDSQSGQPLNGATVTVKGTKQATKTAEDGSFAIQVDGNNSVLVISNVGYTNSEITVRNNASANIHLQPSSGALGEVVVIGYGSVRKSDVTGSVSSIKAKDLTPGANVSIDQALAGRAAGVQVYQKSGEPGSSISVKVRGISSITAGNDPLYVIDGMPVNNGSPVTANGDRFPNNPNPRNPLNSLNPSDIESIEILKDASATAIYGSRGSNGVVLITTKRGAPGRLNINYNSYYGIQKVARKLDLLTGPQYKQVLNDIINAGGGVPSEQVTNDASQSDWQSLLFQNAPTQSHDLSISGGRENMKFYASLGFLNQQGILKGSATRRYTAKFNLDNVVAKKYGFGISLGTSYIHDNYNSVGLGINENGSALYSAIYYDPSYPVYDASGNFYRSPYMSTMDHPLALLNGQYANSDDYRTFGNIYGEYFLVPSLSVKLRVGGDINTSQRNTWVDPSTIQGLPFGGVASINTGTVSYYMGEATLNYNQEFSPKHRVNAFVGATFDRYGSYSFGGTGAGYALPDLTYDAIGSGADSLERVSSGRANNKIISYLARAIYSFNNRYVLTASFRADGSARFGPNNRFAYFPSAAFAWKLNEESFLQNFKALNELKLRTSYGSVGNQNIANYLYITTFSGGGNAIFGNSLYNSIAPTRPANPDLKWEGALQFDAGVDFAFFNRRLFGTIDYFNRKAVDLLLALPLPLSTGFGTKTQNIGDMRNEGIELTLGGDVVRKNQWTWSLNGNISHIKNRVLDLGPQTQIIQGSAGNLTNYEIIKVGESLGSYYGYKVLGVWQSSDDFSTAPVGTKPGDLKFLDVDGNKIINANDRMILGKALPDYTYGFSSILQWKGFSLSAFFDGQQGASNISNTLIDSYYPVSFRRNKLAVVYLNRWTPANPSNTYPGFINAQFSASGSQGNQQINSLTVQDASYFRMQSATLGYKFNLSSRAVKSLQLYVTGQNLFLVTNYIGYDPTLNAAGSDVTKVDYSSYPMAKTWLFGVNVQF